MGQNLALTGDITLHCIRWSGIKRDTQATQSKEGIATSDARWPGRRGNIRPNGHTSMDQRPVDIHFRAIQMRHQGLRSQMRDKFAKAETYQSIQMNYR